jgi:hypothetical protein
MKVAEATVDGTGLSWTWVGCVCHHVDQSGRGRTLHGFTGFWHLTGTFSSAK